VRRDGAGGRTVESRRTTLTTQQEQEDIQPDDEEWGSGDKVLEAEVWIGGSTPAHTDVEARTAA
jgi:hypothetical protein